MSDAQKIKAELKRLGTPTKSKISSWFFKTNPGQYGAGDIFYGITVPEQRKVAEKYGKVSLTEIHTLLHDAVHECRLTALLILVAQSKRADGTEREKIVKFYLSHTKRINNWDLVDVSARDILGKYLLSKKRAILYTLARSKNLWKKRIAIIATYAFIQKEDYADTLKIAEILLQDDHDLIHKAVGWMLREVGNRSLAVEERFLKKYADTMPRTMLRYAIEKFPEQKRKMYLGMKSK